MEPKRSRWQQIKQHPFIVAGIIVMVFALTAFAFAVIKYGWGWTGFTGGESKVTTTMITHGTSTATPGTIVATEQQPTKTLWDWLQLLGILAIPVVVGLGTVLFTTQQANESDKNREKRHKTDIEIADKNREIQQQTDLQIAANNQGAAALQTYLDQMSELVLNKRLSMLIPEDEDVRKIARTRTLIILHLLGPGLKGSILQFLYEAGLISGDKDNVVIQLQGADLSGARLTRIFLNGVNLSRADLNEAILYRTKLTNAILELADLRGANMHEAELISCDLSNADLSEADLSGAILIGANLTGAILTGANFTGADLSGADLREAIGTTSEQLNKAKSLKGATMPDRSKHE
jgi:uncharacterized protein YjbI with pentapeptide repeats